jgi:hypothetical protein
VHRGGGGAPVACAALVVASVRASPDGGCFALSFVPPHPAAIAAQKMSCVERMPAMVVD